MTPRLSISAAIFFTAITALGMYFAFAAVQGPSGILRRIQIESETVDLLVNYDQLRFEVDRMQNLTHRLSDEYLDMDLLDERAREILGVVRADEIVLP